MPRVIIAPFSNSSLRDWPLRHYATLVSLLAGHAEIEIVGTAEQCHAAEPLVMHPGVSNGCGRSSWAELSRKCRDADCVVGNNSGVAHLAGRLGAAVVCVFSASHDRTEWGPLGERVILVSRTMACSPCHLPNAAQCRFGLACLADIDPQDVFRLVMEVIRSSARPAAVQPEPFTRSCTDPVLDAAVHVGGEAGDVGRAIAGVGQGERRLHDQPDAGGAEAFGVHRDELAAMAQREGGPGGGGHGRPAEEIH